MKTAKLFFKIQIPSNKRPLRRGVRSLLALLLASVLLAAPASAEGRYPDKEHLPVDFADMDRGAFDEKPLQAALDEMEALASSPALQRGREQSGTRERIQALYGEILDELDDLSTRNALADILYNASGAEDGAAEALAVLNEQYSRLFDAAWAAMAPLADTPYRDILEADAGEDLVDYLPYYGRTTDEEAALYQEEDRLVQAYDQAMAEPVIIDGTAWTEEALDEADMDAGEYWDLYERMMRAQNEAVGELYRQLVQVRTKIAKEGGYDDYAEYAYRAVYGRDYSNEDIQKILDEVKQNLVPLWEKIDASVSGYALQSLELRSSSSGEEVLDAIQPFLEEASPELAESFRFLRQYHLYDIEASPSKLPVGFTISLPAYGSAFVFNCPYGTYQDYSDMVHEFGHFNEAYYAAGRELWTSTDTDVGELQAQALELLFTSRAEEVFPTCGDTYTALIVCNLLDSVLEGCMYEEFQTAVYQDPDMTLEEINRLFKDISEQYGYYYGPRETESYFWVQVSHNFSSPMYYISYATSALSALELWLRSLEDWDGAMETYMELTALPQGLSYRGAVKEAGLKDIFRRGTVKGIAKDLEAAFNRNWGPAEPEAGTMAVLWGAPAALALGLFTLRRRRQEAQAGSRWRQAEPPWEL